MKYKIGDIVTRESYNNDTIFKIIDIKEDLYILKGINIRLCADSLEEDLNKYNDNQQIIDDDSFFLKLRGNFNLDRSEYFYLPGKVLHIDGDNEYLDRCLKFYKEANIQAYGFYVEENSMASNIRRYLDEINPDILVITGHDAYYVKQRNDNVNYKNTSNFIKCVKEARKYEKAHDKLIIIAGACQSNYEELIKAGANFASSPKRTNIHALDPAIVAVSIGLSDRSEDIDLIGILEKTKYGSDGMGGLKTKGTMYVGYPRE